MLKLFLFLVALVVVAEAVNDYVAKLVDDGKEDLDEFELGSNGDDIMVPLTGRNAIKSSKKKWANGEIFYTFTTDYDDKFKRIIRKAMEDIQKNTCITFKERSTKDPEVNYITFAAHNSGEKCASFVGMKGGEQVVWLSYNGKGTCFTNKIVTHELMHAIGLDHEHNRADRKKFVKIHEANVNPDNLRVDFKEVSDKDFSDYGCPYTYESVMHYSKTAFGNPKGTLTMEPIPDENKQKYLNVIGNVKGAHPNDYEKINRMYGCNDEVTVVGQNCGAIPSKCVGCAIM